jgi:hypothetical protein
MRLGEPIVGKNRDPLIGGRRARKSPLVDLGAKKLGAKRKPQALAADAVSLWIFKRSLQILDRLLLYPTKLMKRS